MTQLCTRCHRRAASTDLNAQGLCPICARDGVDCVVVNRGNTKMRVRDGFNGAWHTIHTHNLTDDDLGKLEATIHATREERYPTELEHAAIWGGG